METKPKDPLESGHNSESEMFSEQHRLSSQVEVCRREQTKKVLFGELVLLSSDGAFKQVGHSSAGKNSWTLVSLAVGCRAQQAASQETGSTTGWT